MREAVILTIVKGEVLLSVLSKGWRMEVKWGEVSVKKKGWRRKGNERGLSEPVYIPFPLASFWECVAILVA